MTENKQHTFDKVYTETVSEPSETATLNDDITPRGSTISTAFLAAVEFIGERIKEIGWVQDFIINGIFAFFLFVVAEIVVLQRDIAHALSKDEYIKG
ncbi:MAG: hypothetical protein ACI82A_001444 [Candidatus Azotimanducaceae bacterium]|jgi:hypothetical protein